MWSAKMPKILFATPLIFTTFAIDIMKTENAMTMDSGISMMTTQRLEQILKNGESYNIEYKTCRNKLSGSVFETVCSFSNRYGGIF